MTASTEGRAQSGAVGVLFRRGPHAGIGELGLRAMCIPDDIAVVHDWVSRDYARFWGLVGSDRRGVERVYREITAAEHVSVYLGLHAGRPSFLVETYIPAHEPIGRYYAAEPGDRGMHVLVAPTRARVPGFTWAVFTLVLDFLFSDHGVQRIVVEPDVRNAKIIALNQRAGFEPETRVELPATATAPGKIALLSFCTRAAYFKVRAKEEFPSCQPPRRSES